MGMSLFLAILAGEPVTNRTARSRSGARSSLRTRRRRREDFGSVISLRPEEDLFEYGRVRAHLSGDARLCKNNGGVGPCPSVPADVKMLFYKSCHEKLTEKEASARVAEVRKKIDAEEKAENEPPQPMPKP